MGHERFGEHSNSEGPLPSQLALEKFFTHPNSGVRKIRFYAGISELGVIASDALRVYYANGGLLTDAGSIATLDQIVSQFSEFRKAAQENPETTVAKRQFLREVWRPYIDEASLRVPGATFNMESHRCAVIIDAADHLLSDLFGTDY